MAKDSKMTKEELTVLKHKANIAAARLLRNRDCEILAEGYTCKHGSCDIIAREGNTLVFVEVQVENDAEMGFPQDDAISPDKRDKHERVAMAYLTESDYVDMAVRFDTISVVVLAADRALLRHHISAFSKAA